MCPNPNSGYSIARTIVTDRRVGATETTAEWQQAEAEAGVMVWWCDGALAAHSKDAAEPPRISRASTLEEKTRIVVEEFYFAIVNVRVEKSLEDC